MTSYKVGRAFTINLYFSERTWSKTCLGLAQELLTVKRNEGAQTQALLLIQSRSAGLQASLSSMDDHRLSPGGG